MAFQNYWTEVAWDTSLRNLGRDGEELVIDGQKITPGAPTITPNRFSRAAIIQNTADGTVYQNTGTTAAPVWSLVDTAGGAGITQLTGDVTAGPGTGSQAATIAANAVTSGKILNGAVTYGKIQNVTATNRVLGRSTAGAGAVEEITVGGDITQSGSTFTIGNGAVSYAKIQDVSATNRILGRSTAGSGDVEEITVGGDITQSGSNFNLAAGSVDLANLSSGITTVSRALYDQLYTTVGGSAAEVVTLAGVLATDRVYATIADDGVSRVLLSARTGSGNVTLTFDADPGTSVIVNLMVTRTTA